MTTGERSRVLMIGLDAAEISLLSTWMADGSLPHLRALAERGVFTRLESTAGLLSASAWPSFYTGTSPATHGLYHYLAWRPEQMAIERPSPRWLPLEPFWRRLGHGRRAIAIDVPLVYAPQAFDGVEISGWGTHELLAPTAIWPASVAAWIAREFGPPLRDAESFHALTERERCALRDRWVRITNRVAEMACALMHRETWDLLIACFSATHRGGHKLWSQALATRGPSGNAVASPGALLKSIYVACDAAVGRLIAEVGQSATVLVFSMHGMGSNTSRAELHDEMLRRVLDQDDGRSPKWRAMQLAAACRTLVPGRARSWAKGLLPVALQDRLTGFWRTAGVDWSRTPAFALHSDLHGYVRINLAGREARGIVEPGAQFDALCRHIEHGLRSFVDAVTGEPVVAEVLRTAGVLPDGPMLNHLPDLIVRWAARPATVDEELVSHDFGSVRWPVDETHPAFREGNHRPDGFLLAAGARVRPTGPLTDAHILDLAPTVHSLLGLAVPVSMQGRVLI